MNATTTVRTFRLPRYTSPRTGHGHIDSILQSLGGFGINGAYGLTGGRDLMFGAKPVTKATKVNAKGFIENNNSFVSWRVNTGRTHVKLIISEEPGDELTVRLWKQSSQQKLIKTGIIGEVLYERHAVDPLELINVCDELYVAYIKKFHQGFIPL